MSCTSVAWSQIAAPMPGWATDAELGAGDDVAKGERDRLGLEDDGVRRAGRRANEAEVLLVERLRCVEVADLQGEEVGAGGGHGCSFIVVSVF